MEKLDLIKNFNEYRLITESISDGHQSEINAAFRNLGVITFNDGRTVTPDEVIDVFQKAIDYLKLECPKTFYFGNKTLSIIYLVHSKKYKTMAVDSHMNLYVNVGYVFNYLKMDPELIAAVLMHEVFHITYDHIERGKNWLAAMGKPVNKANWHDTNLAADVEVNQSVIKAGITTEDKLVNEIHGIYLKSGNRGGMPSVATLEMILNNEEYMNILRRMCPPDIDPEAQPPINTTDDWDSGYKELWNKLVPLIKKYGWKGIWQKLQDAKLINGVGEVGDITVDDIKKGLDEIDFNPNSMNYLQVKSFDDFINESINPNPSGNNDMGKTYDNGYMTSFTALIDTIKRVLDGPQGGGGGGGPQGPEINSKLKEEELEPLDLPDDDSDNDDDDNDSDTNNNGLPQNIRQKQKKNKNSKSKPKPKDDGSDGSDGSNSSDDESNDKKDSKSAGKMIDDLKKKMDKQGQGGDGSDSEEDGESGKGRKSSGGSHPDNEYGPDGVPSGGTGGSDDEGDSVSSFVDDDEVPDDDDLRESGYSEEDIENINKVRKITAQKNSPERIKKILNDYRNQLPSGHFIGKLLDTIDVESRKYKNIWESILKKFLSNKTRRAGKDTNTGFNDWKNKKKIALGDYGIHRQKQAQDPQDVNIYVDVSGSMDEELLEIIAKSLVILSEQNEYSGINVCPWASNSMGVVKIESLYDGNKDKVVADIMGAISLGKSKCGGGTESTAAMMAMLSCIEENLKDKRKNAKDDVHVVITDGEVSGLKGIEGDIENALFQTFKRRDVSTKATKNTFWMIYDANESLRKYWENEIQKGTLVFINSETVKNNKKR